MTSLVLKSARMSFYLLLLLVLPVLSNCEYLLELWLDDVPDGTARFVSLFLILSLSECLSNPLMTAALATGRIRNYQIIVGGLIMLNLPVSYICLKAGAPPESTVVVAIVISQLCLAARLLVLRKMMDFPVRRYLEKVYLNVLAVTFLSVIFLPLLPQADGRFGHFLLNVFLCMAITALWIVVVGCSKAEVREIKSVVLNRFRK